MKNPNIHPQHYENVYSHQVVQQKAAAYIVMLVDRSKLMKPGETCQHVGGNFAAAEPQWSEDKRTVIVTQKCAGCGQTNKFRQTMDGPWERV